MARNEWIVVRGFDGLETGRVDDGRVGSEGSSLQFGIGATGTPEDLMLFRRVDARTKTGRMTVYFKRILAPWPRIESGISQEALLTLGSSFSLRSFSRASGAGLAFDVLGILWFTQDVFRTLLFSLIRPLGLPSGPTFTPLGVLGELELDANDFAGLRIAIGEHYTGQIRMRGEALIEGVWRPYLDAGLPMLFSDPNLGDMFGISQQSIGNTLGSSVRLDSLNVEAGDFLPELALPRLYTFDDDTWETELVYPDTAAALLGSFFFLTFKTVLPVRVPGTQPTGSGTHLLRITRFGLGQESITRSLIFPDAGEGDAGRKAGYWFRYLGGTELSIITEFRPESPYTPSTVREQLKLDFVTGAPGFSDLFAAGFGLLETNVAVGEFFYVEFSVQDEVITPALTLVDPVSSGATAIHVTDVSEVTLSMVVELGAGLSKERFTIASIDTFNDVLNLNGEVFGNYNAAEEVRIGYTRRVAKYRRGAGTLTTIQDAPSATAEQPCFGRRVVVRLDRDLSSTLQPVPTDVDYDDFSISDMPELAV